MLIRHLSQLIIEETESLLEKWKHPDPYRAPTAPGGSKYERNLPVPSTERESPSFCLAKTSNLHGQHPS
jgi:NADH dehydrogenase (ubiquinone) 1 beta subcomplex subunit 9